MKEKPYNLGQTEEPALAQPVWYGVWQRVERAGGVLTGSSAKGIIKWPVGSPEKDGV